MNMIIRAQAVDRRTGMLQTQVTQGKDTVGLIDMHVSDRNGVTMREVHLFDINLLPYRDRIMSFAYDVMKEGVKRREL